MPAKTPKLDPTALSQFTGTMQYHKLTFSRLLLFTDGLAYIAKEANAYWLMDLIMSHIATNKVLKEEPFMSFKLTTDIMKHSAQAAFEDGNLKKLASQEILYTDFPLPEISFFIQRQENGSKTSWIVMLPSEY